jgi:hypothetical protein
MPAQQSDYANITKYQEKAASLNKQAAGMESTAFTLPDTVMGAVRSDRQSRGVSKLATDVGNVMGQMVTDPTQIREGPQSLSSQGLVDPFSVNQLTSNARAQNLKTLGTAATQGQLNQGSLDQVIQAGANQLKARAATLQAQAEEANSQAVALQGEWERMIAEKEAEAKLKAASYNPFEGLNLDTVPTTPGAPGTPVEDDFQEEPQPFPWGQAISGLIPEIKSPTIGLPFPGLNISLKDLIAKIQGKSSGKTSW